LDDESAIVFDPFSGSGTTLIACEQLGRRCRAVEIAPGYVAVALERWATATGRTPVLLEGAE
jgi:DNA modification methylase